MTSDERSGADADDPGVGPELDISELYADSPPSAAAPEPDRAVEPVAVKPSRPPKVAKDRSASLRSRLYHGNTRLDFIRRQKIFFVLSAAVILIGVFGGIVRGGLNLGIEFEGGTTWKVPTGESVSRVKEVMSELGHGEAKVQRFEPGVGDPFVQVSTKLEGSAREIEAEGIEIRDRLSNDVAGKAPVDLSSVGPSWGGEITRKARNALIIFFLVIAAYLWLRFEWRMAVGAIGAVVHDILVTMGVYAVVGFEVTPASVVAFLTILGYSLYDTVVVFDRIDENARSLGATGRHTFSEVVNISMNQVLMRSLNTSLVAILPILSVLVIGVYALGATSLKDFGLALFIGLVTGAYSSIFIATPIVAALKEREPRWAQIRARLAQRGALGDLDARTPGTLRPAGRRPAIAGDAPVPEAAASTKTMARPAVQPRPRKKGKKR